MGSLREIAEIRPMSNRPQSPGYQAFARQVLASRLFQTARQRAKLRQIARSLTLAAIIVGASLLAKA
jgi:hypothetical protein